MTRDQDGRALRAFAEHLARQPGAGCRAIDDLCRTHPDLEPSLRHLARKRDETKFRAPRVELGRIADLRARLLEDFVGPGAALDSGGQRYVLLGELAHGGMGVILNVWDTVLERPLAMKVLDVEARPGGSAEADEALARFIAEAQVAAQLSHPGVVPIYDMGADETGRLYFTMPLIEGRDLGAVFDLARARSGGWTLTSALLLVGKLCEVMAYAHSRGVIHRDLKPANVMVGAFGEIYVVDWGLAKFADRPEPSTVSNGSTEEPEARAGQTLDGTVAGTPPYMAPEQAQGRVADVSFRTDVYALGAILYRLLAGHGPYASRRGPEDPATTLELIRRGPPTPLRRLAPEAPAELVSICEKAMAWSPEERYASVGEGLAQDLHEFLEERVTGARRPGFWSAARQKLRWPGRAGSSGASGP